MKKIFLVTMLSFIVCFGQWSDKGSIMLWQGITGNDGVIGRTNDGVDTTRAFYSQNLEGIITIFFDTDTTGASVASGNQSDSCITIWFQQYYRAAGGGWAKHYNSTETYGAKIDTVSRAKAKTSSGDRQWMDFSSKSDDLSPADSMRFIIGIGVGDSLKLDIGVKRQ